MSRYRAVGSGYPDYVTPGLTDAERAWVDRHRETIPLNDPTRKTGAANYHKGENPPRLWVSAMSEAEALEWFRTGVLPP